MRQLAVEVEQYTEQLIEALEHYKSREERVTNLVHDNSKSWNALYQQVEAKDKRNAELVEALEKAQTINAAAEKLVRCKGRYHSELNYRALAAMFGVTTPDLPPLDSESRTVKLPEGLIKAVSFYEQVKRENTPVETGVWKDAIDWVLKEATAAAGIKWEAE
nr:hypothetical protein [Klebsiella huaxiensis]